MPEDSNKKLYYNTVLCQAFSPTRNFLLAGNIYGDVSIYNLPKVLGPRQTDNENELLGPTYTLSAHPDSRVQSMAATDNFLVTGSTGEIAGWDWNIILSNKAPKAKPSWNIQIPADKDSFEKPDVNCIVYCKENQVLYLGCGDNKIYIVELEDGKILRQLAGHKDYIHGLARINNQLASSSEDGTVRLWDLRKFENTNILTPYLNNKVARPHLGKWIGAVDFTEDWLLCGGGPNLSLWHLRTMEAAMIFDLPDEGIHVAEIYEERIIAGGTMPNTYHLTYQGDVLAKVPTSSNTVYSIVFRETPHKRVSVSERRSDIFGTSQARSKLPDRAFGSYTNTWTLSTFMCGQAETKASSRKTRVPERETNFECSDRSRTAVKINTLHQVFEKVSDMKNLEYVGCQAHNEELTKRVINYYLVMRGYFLARSVNENNHARKINTKDNSKKSKL